MIRIIGTVIFTVTSIILLVVAGCADLGNGSEIPNGLVTVSGSVAENQAVSSPRSGVHVVAIESDYVPIWGNPHPGVEAITDSQGSYSLSLYKGVNYNIYYTDSMKLLGAVKEDVMIEPRQSLISPVELDSLARINGNIYRESSTQRYDIFLRGSPYSQKITTTNKFLFEKIPAARYTLGVITLQSDNIRIIVWQQQVEVPAGSVVVVDSVVVGD